MDLRWNRSLFQSRYALKCACHLFRTPTDFTSLSSSYRPETRFVYKFDYKSSPAKREYIVPAASELPAIDTGEFPPDLMS